ncbi:hypothetical protein [Erwinia sp. S38]|uniref:hypothetical protein n=1 Tax=Erwinia sp. S38 TaxID=2769338 RepID=UPI0019093D05|nr:hypothetical protein [Erwinia sp. S38]MBK0003630.1 hypothetical protein [Erwinia sp. S38]
MMEVLSSSDPLYTLFMHPKSKLIVSRFRSLAGEKKMSEWQVFNVLLAGFLNCWAVKSDNFSIHIDFAKSNNFDFLFDKINVTVTIEGMSGESNLLGPDFSLPQYDSPYEFCRLVNKKEYDSRTTYLGMHGKSYHKANFQSLPQPDGHSVLTWEGTVMVYDKAFFHPKNYATTLGFLQDDLHRTVFEALVKRFTQFSALYDYLFRPLRTREA